MRICRDEYVREGGRHPGDRIVRCHLPAGHPGEHEEADTEVTWINEATVSPPPEVSPQEQWVSPVHTTSADEKSAFATLNDAIANAYEAGVAAGRTQAAHRAADALMMASNDIKSARAGRLTATPRLPGAGDAQRVSEWLRRLSEIYRREAELPEGQENT